MEKKSEYLKKQQAPLGACSVLVVFKTIPKYYYGVLTISSSNSRRFFLFLAYVAMLTYKLAQYLQKLND